MSAQKQDEQARKKAAEALLAALPAPDPKRKARLILALSPQEKARIMAYAKETGEPLAVAARNLLLAALTTLGK